MAHWKENEYGEMLCSECQHKAIWETVGFTSEYALTRFCPFCGVEILESPKYLPQNMKRVPDCTRFCNIAKSIWMAELERKQAELMDQYAETRAYNADSAVMMQSENIACRELCADGICPDYWYKPEM